LNDEEPIVNVYPHRIAFNCLPQIDDFLANGYTKEEMKMVNETKKIFSEPIHWRYRHDGKSSCFLWTL